MSYFQNITDADTLKAEYRRLCKELHPDKGGSNAEFLAMQIEYNQRLKEIEEEAAEAQAEADRKAGEAARKAAEKTARTEAAKEGTKARNTAAAVK